MSSGSFENKVTYKLHIYKSYIYICIYVCVCVCVCVYKGFGILWYTRVDLL